MVINLTAPRVISYRITELDNINKIEYIISFPSGIKHSFPVDLDKDTGEVTIKLPILQDIIKDEFTGIGYILITRTDGYVLDLRKEDIHFVVAHTIEVTIAENLGVTENLEPVNRMALRNNEVLISHSNTLDFIMSNVDRIKKN